MATDPDRGEFHEDDEQDELARRSIFSAGWFRALLVLTVLAIVVVVSLPYLLNWLEPTPAPPVKPPAKSGAPASSPGPAPAPPITSPSPPTLIPAPAAPPSPAPAPPVPSVAEAPKPAPAPAPTAPSPADRPVGTAPLPVAPAPAVTPGPAAKPAPGAQTESPKASTAPKQGAPVAGGSPGGYWVQVGAFLEEKNAQALAKQLRGESFPVQISQVTRGGGPAAAQPARPAGAQNQLFITGSTPDAVNAALKGRGTAQAVKGGVVVSPPFDLETAMSLSSSLKKDGFKVVIRRAKAAPAKAGSGPTLHVVRVGGFADRAKAQQARGDLEAKGHPAFLTQGAAR